MKILFWFKLSKLELHDIEEGPTELPVLTEEEINDTNIGSVYCEVSAVQNQMKGMNPDLGAIAEFKRKVSAGSIAPWMVDFNTVLVFFIFKYIKLY